MNPDTFDPIPPDRAEAIAGSLNQEPFLRWIGIRFEDVRSGYARLRLPYRKELNQGDGVVHGGAIAAAIDTAVIGAILSTLRDRPRRLATVDLHVQYLDRVVDEDVIAEARVRRRGQTIVFVEVDARTDGGRE
ncbi:MAG: PaaI family thioesterase, partial [Vicinamibacterales bacterium]